MEQNGPIQIDLHSVLASKLGGKARYVPDFVVRFLEKTIHKDELNELLRSNYPMMGAEFCNGVLNDLDITTEIVNAEKLPDISNRRIIIACNHPLGGLDGMALIREFSSLYGNDLRFIVNDLLMAVKPLSNVFLPINKHGSQSRQAIADINKVMAGDGPVMVFPAGLVSRLGNDGVIRDLTWNKMFVSKAIEYQRDILPIHFSGENSKFFYKFAKWRKRLGVKFNIEMIYLPGELFKSRGCKYTISIGDIIPWQSLPRGNGMLEQAQKIKDIVYSL